MAVTNCAMKGKGPSRSSRKLSMVVWILAIGATVAGLRYGLPPKEGLAMATIWWFPFALLLYPVLPGDELAGLFLVLLQFPLFAALMTFGFRKWPASRVIAVALVMYLTGVVVCVAVLKLNGIAMR